MLGIIKKQLRKLQAIRLKRAEESIQKLKIRYHTFRILLINNERALKILNGIDVKLKTAKPSRRDLSDQVDELLAVCYELVDGLNRLSDNKYFRLYELHETLGNLIRKALPEASQIFDKGTYCLFLDEITPETKKMVGGKAGSLSELKKINIPVPDGFVITLAACREFLRANDLETPIRQRLRKLENDDGFLRDLEAIVVEIRKMILSGRVTGDLEHAFKTAYDLLVGYPEKSISVRSSAGVEDQLMHSFAGQFATVLNVTSFEKLIEAFKEVLASSFNTRSIIYRLHAGLSLTEFDMAILCQLIVRARTAGVLLTIDPSAQNNKRMLVSAVAGLGSLAVGGEAPADVYHPSRSEKEIEIPSEIAEKTYREVCSPEGGVRREEVPQEQRHLPLLSVNEIHRLVDFGRMIESLKDRPQDIEWAIAGEGTIYILQSRPFRPGGKRAGIPETMRGEILFQGGALSSSGRNIGRVKIIHSSSDFDGLKPGPVIPVLHQSLVDVARYMQNISGIIVDKGSPADHLSNVAREYGIPMLTRTEKATHILHDDQWIILDADRSIVLQAPQDVWPGVWQGAGQGLQANMPFIAPPKIFEQKKPSGYPESERLQNLIVALNLTDAYGPAFSIWECRSLHDLIRYVHEMAVFTMFEAGDEILEKAGIFVHRFDSGINFHFLIIDMGGGLAPGPHSMKIGLSDIVSIPLLALWNGVSTPGLRWNVPPPAVSLSGLFGKSLTDGRSPRPVGNSSYALIAKDYLNLNARVDFHFTMIDTVCGRNPRDNYIRFRFKGGGTTQVQRDRRAKLIAEVLEKHDFFTDCKGDLVTGTITEMAQASVEERLVMLGRLIGFSRLMDAMMHTDESPRLLARAFLEGNYSLEGFHPE